ncbi:MAG: vitamin B12-dependent ribonucleotide reductase [Dehalococcoidia bacterium]|nr:vitamin B12-dependent ribonucleotide reductase [Dehalococcoidia bacterium]
MDKSNNRNRKSAKPASGKNRRPEIRLGDKQIEHPPLALQELRLQAPGVVSVTSGGHGAAARGAVDPRRAAPLVRVPSAVPGLDIAPNAYEVLKRRYLAKDRDGKVVETPEQMFRRVARNLAEGEIVEDHAADVSPIFEEFYHMMSKLEFLPNSPTIMNAGRDLQQLSACFVLPVPDDMQGIFASATHTAMIHKSGGGTGFAFSRIRPENDVVGSTGGIASGPVSFIRIFDTATEVVKQGGTRRGANMGILSVQHPDVLKFIHAKDDDKSLQNFNISVAVTEKFMDAVERGTDYDLINPRNGQVTGRHNAREVFDQLVNSAWKTGDPGIIFIDRMNTARSSPVPKRGPIEATNPCGEQPLYPYDSCNLGSINLAQMVTDLPIRTVDWEKLERTVFTAVRFLDNVVTMNRYPIAQIEEVSKSIRRIGLGVMGWADMLLMMGAPYDSEEALHLAEQVMAFIQEKADEASMALAEERGAFPDWDDSVYGPLGPLGPRRLRNSTRTTIAPTGTISIIANCSSGIEPLFALSYSRTVMEGTKLIEVNPYFEAVARREGFYSQEMMEELARRGSVKGMPGVPQWVQRLFVTSHDIAPEWHVRMQAAFQRFTDNAVSKTVNFGHDASVEDVRTVYRLAYKTGCKGVTIYRDGSKSMQVLSTGKTEQARTGEGKGEGKSEAKIVLPIAEATPAPAPAREPAPAEQHAGALQQAEQIASGPVPRHPRERPVIVRGMTHRVRTGHGNMYITLNLDERGKPFEVFSALGKAGGCDSAQLEAISRLVSLALRAGVDIESIVQQLRGITCCPAWDNGNLVRSAPDAVAFALAGYVGASQGDASGDSFTERTMDGAQLGLFNPEQAKGQAAPLPARSKRAPEMTEVMRCPDCSGRLSYQEGCLMCHACGFNKCG